MPPQRKKILGIDYGSKRIGLALSDESGTYAFPHSVVSADDDPVGDITQIIEEEAVGEIVLGESINLSGEDNPIMKEIIAFKDAITKKTGLSVHFEKEYFTSAQAARVQGNVETLDASAAALILQSFIDTRSQTKV